MKTSIIASVLILIAIILGVCISKQACRQNALLNEYEFLIAESWQARQDCMDQLGVFYKGDE